MCVFVRARAGDGRRCGAGTEYLARKEYLIVRGRVYWNYLRRGVSSCVSSLVLKCILPRVKRSHSIRIPINNI